MDENTNIITTYDQSIAALPEDIRELFDDLTLHDAIYDIAAKHSVPADKEFLLILITKGILMGTILPKDFVKLISESLGFTREKSSLIAQEINKDVFNYVKDTLQILYTSGNKGDTKSQASDQITERPLGTAPVATPRPISLNLEALKTSSPKLPIATNSPQPEAFMPQPHIGNIFEEKLGGAFRLSVPIPKAENTTPLVPAANSVTATNTGIPTMPAIPMSPRQVIPPPPQQTVPPPPPPMMPVPVPSAPSTAKASDPYREPMA